MVCACVHCQEWCNGGFDCGKAVDDEDRDRIVGYGIFCENFVENIVVLAIDGEWVECKGAADRLDKLLGWHGSVVRRLTPGYWY